MRGVYIERWWEGREEKCVDLANEKRAGQTAERNIYI